MSQLPRLVVGVGGQIRGFSNREQLLVGQLEFLLRLPGVFSKESPRRRPTSAWVWRCVGRWVACYVLKKQAAAQPFCIEKISVVDLHKIHRCVGVFPVSIVHGRRFQIVPGDGRSLEEAQLQHEFECQCGRQRRLRTEHRIGGASLRLHIGVAEPFVQRIV